MVDDKNDGGGDEGGDDGMSAWERRFAERRRSWHRRPKVVRVLIVMAIAALAATVVGLVVMGLWNVLVPAVFAGPAITWPQALGLFVLGRILFGGWGRRHGCHGGGHWRGRFQRKMDTLTPEQRERMRSMLHGHGPHGPHGSHAT